MVDLPIADAGSARSIRGIRAPRSVSAVSETSTPGAIAPPRYSPSSETQSKLMPVPKSTTTQAAADAVEGGDRVDEAVRADLVGVVDPNRHARLDPGPDLQEARVEVALRHPLVLGAERRHHRGDRDRVDPAALDPAQGEQAGDALGDLIAGRAGDGSKAPVLDQLGAVEGAEVRLGVADVDSEKHEHIC